jgi:hypothetical protein
MRVRAIAVLMGLVLIVSACSSSDSEEATADTGSATTVASATGDTAAPATTTTAGNDGGETAPPAGGDGTATVNLDNGESYTFSILCGLETQEVAGVEILFTAVSYDEPLGFDVTQFGDGGDTLGAIDDLGTISIYDSATFDDVWGAGSIVAQLSQSEFSLELNGSTITGSGLFFTGEDVDNLALDAGVPGELVANCG